MKRRLYGILCLLPLLLLAGCDQGQGTEAALSPGEMASIIEESQPQEPALTRLSGEETMFSAWLSDCYQLSPEEVADGVICYADGVEASEIAVLRLTEGAEAAQVQAALEAYIQSRSMAFAGYAPQQAALAEGGITAQNGRYVALLICQDPSAAEAAFQRCFTGEAQGHPMAGTAAQAQGEASQPAEGAEDPYDEAAVLQAWRTGEKASLTETNREILQAAEEVLRQEIRSDMSAYEKELAIHDWITGWSRFDSSIFSRTEAAGAAQGSDTPYGVLIRRSAMCHGYSSTFQLFMDMLDIPCLTVYGTPGGNGVGHSWNMVCLEGEWYCVDVAWDDPIGGSPGHTYFNVTSKALKRGTIHRWDESTVPEATGTKYAYQTQ